MGKNNKSSVVVKNGYKNGFVNHHESEFNNSKYMNGYNHVNESDNKKHVSYIK